MRIRDLCRPLYEASYGVVRVNPSTAHPTGEVNVIRNPSKDVLHKWGATRAFLVKGSLIAWGISPLHYEVARQIGLDDDPYVLPVVLFPDGNDASVQVTDYSKNTKWHHSPGTASSIRNHPYMRKMFGDNVEIDYYDDAVVGDWEEL